MKILTDKMFTEIKTLRAKTVIFGLLLLTACHSQKTVPVANTVEQNRSENSASSDHLMMSTLWFQNSLEAKQLYLQGYELAKIRLIENLESTGQDRSPALIIDIDETILDNSPYEASLIVRGNSFDPESWNQWVDRAAAELLPGAREFLQFAEERGVEVFYISNRSEENIEPTLENLQKYDLPFADEEHVLLKKNSSDKGERRLKVMEEHSVVLFIGDQLTDFSERFAEGSPEILEEERKMGDGSIGEEGHTLHQHFILLPNPMYGSFESRMYSRPDLTEKQKRDIRLQNLKTAE